MVGERGEGINSDWGDQSGKQEVYTEQILTKSRCLTKYDKDFFSESDLQMQKIQVTVRESTTQYISRTKGHN